MDRSNDERAAPGFNIARECIDRHVDAGRGDDQAIRFLVAGDIAGGPASVRTFKQLAIESSRFAAGLDRLGVRSGDRVVVLGNRTPRTYEALLGCFRGGYVACPIFSAFGPEPIRERMEIGDVAAVVTSRAIYERKLEPMRDRLPARWYVLTDVDDPAETADGTIAWGSVSDPDDDTIGPIAPTTHESPALIHFTSGTTGTPKGALHVHGAAVMHRATTERVLGLGRGDVFWCTADPGWVTGTSYGLIGPLATGATVVVDEAEFDAVRWYELLAAQGVDVWYTSPTAIRMLMRSGDTPLVGRDLSRLRDVFSVGEPLAADAVAWGERALGRPIRDTWWQTETGAIMIANAAGSVVQPGSMGRPVDGLDIALLTTDEDGSPVVDEQGHLREIVDPATPGMIAVRPGWASMFRGYVGAPDRYDRSFVDGWYLSGDLATRSADGSFWFVGRSDDVIKTAGHLVGPFEVERVLDDHDDVVASGVYGVPDAIAGEAVHACVILRPGAEANPSTEARIIAHCRRHLGAALAPRRVTIVDDLPTTRSGKIMRRVLRARELGLAEGDLSALDRDLSAAGT